MEENKIIESVNEGVVEEVYEEVTSNGFGIGKIAIGLAVVGAVAFAGYKIYKRVKKNRVVEVDETEVADNSETDKKHK